MVTRERTTIVAGHGDPSMVAARLAGIDAELAYLAGHVTEARQIHLDLLPVVVGIMTRTQGAIMTKAALRLLGLPGGVTRSPLIDATQPQIEQLRTDLVAGGVKLPA